MKMELKINTAVAALRQRLVEDCNSSGLPVTVINLIVTDLVNAVRAQETAALAAEAAAPAAEKEGENNAQGYDTNTGDGAGY